MKPASPEAVAALADAQPRSADKVFPWTHATLVYARTDALGVHWRPHESRRAVVMAILHQTDDPALAGRYVGHGSVKTTLRYRVVDAEESAGIARRRWRR